jgi:3-hydroxyisobutyrate dehydrogenase-like beta-hydroxyacid dehydrogenase
VTGKEHYEKAEHLLSNWEDEYRLAGQASDAMKMKMLEEMAPSVLACAQVHATLALTQATLVGMEINDWEKS